MIISNNTISSSLLNGIDGKIETPNVKKRHRRMKSSGMKNTECDGKPWFVALFQALSSNPFVINIFSKTWLATLFRQLYHISKTFGVQLCNVIAIYHVT
jgi:Arf-GAP/GTPase/ANK repeat/PH domain-containing protein 1/3